MPIHAPEKQGRVRSTTILTVRHGGGVVMAGDGQVSLGQTVIKRGARGITVVGEQDLELPGVPVDVLDSTGAGDALAAGFLVGGPQLAVETAARCVAQLGTMP